MEELINDKRQFPAGLDGVIMECHGLKLLGGFYKGEGDTPRPTAILIHGLPGVEKHLDIAYKLRDMCWNCLYFHFRGCWGSEGKYSLDGLVGDTKTAIDWIVTQPCVDTTKIVLIAGSTGSYPALMQGAIDERINAIIGISPVIEPKAFNFPVPLADSFSKMLVGIGSVELISQWHNLGSLHNAIQKFSPRPVLLVAAGSDSIFPLSDYVEMVKPYRNVYVIEKANADHGFSSSRTWLVETVMEWLEVNIK
jgi:alpha/beta superfamily hydrolase